jgi:hypothetical protein
MEQIIIEGRVDIRCRASRDLAQAHASQIDAEPLIVPKALVVQTIDTQEESQKNDQQKHDLAKARPLLIHNLKMIARQSPSGNCLLLDRVALK